MSAETLTTELRQALRALKLSPMKETLPERLTLARTRKMGHEAFLELVLTDEVERRQRLMVANRARRGALDPQMTLEGWDDTAKVSFDRELLSDLATLRFLQDHHHVLILGPVGVGKTFLASALGHIACRRGHSVVMARADRLLKGLKAARLDATYDVEMRRLIRTELLIIDDLGIDILDPEASRDLYEIIVERHRRGSMVVTSNREPQEWLATMSDPLRAQSAIDRLQNGAHELVIEGESYRKRQKPRREVSR